MRTTQATIDEILACIASAGEVRARKMFGEYAIYCNDKVVALACRDELFIKATPAGQTMAPELELEPAYPGAKPGLHIPKDRWNEGTWLADLVRTTADDLPAKKKKR